MWKVPSSGHFSADVDCGVVVHLPYCDDIRSVDVRDTAEEVQVASEADTLLDGLRFHYVRCLFGQVDFGTSYLFW